MGRDKGEKNEESVCVCVCVCVGGGGIKHGGMILSIGALLYCFC